MKNLILIVFVLFAFDVKAQIDTPPNAQPGKCYAKVKTDSTDVLGHWEEVLCGEKITPQLIQKISKEFNYKGYKVDVFNEKLDANLRDIIRKYQKDNNLPVGALNIKTLEALGVSY